MISVMGITDGGNVLHGMAYGRKAVSGLLVERTIVRQLHLDCYDYECY
jgi:hypothetical protein